MIARNLSSSDMCEVSGATLKLLRMRVEEGVIKPIEGGGGKGKHRQFALNHALALTFFCKVVEGGMRGPAMMRVPEYLIALGEEELLAKFRAGRTHLIIAPDMVRLIRPPCDGLEMLNVEKVYHEVVEAIETLEAELNQTSGRGRRRGLAMAKAET